jgi:CheY-like chemotaxis protein
MGGDISVRSELGAGSKFHFNILIETEEGGDVTVTQIKKEALVLAPNQPIYRLLVVEDRETNRRLLVKLLDQLGFEVREAVNGHEAVDTYQRWKPHLIWMDMRMPIMNGREATKAIKSMTGAGSVPIIALTATAFEEDREEILLDGCDDFVRKPFRKSEISDILEKHLNVRFIYREDTRERDERVVITPEASTDIVKILSKQPTSWLEALQEATLRADVFLIHELIDQIRDKESNLADLLSELTERFDYNQILGLIQDAGEK